MTTLTATQVQAWNKALSAFPIVNQLSTAASVTPVSLAAVSGLGLIGCILVLIGVWTSFVCNVVGFAYPAYKSYQLLESKADGAAMRSCLTYWVVLGLFMLVEGLLDWLLVWVPMYVFVRLGFQGWLFAKDFAGADALYKGVLVQPLTRFDEFIKILTKDSIVHNINRADSGRKSD